MGDGKSAFSRDNGGVICIRGLERILQQRDLEACAFNFVNYFGKYMAYAFVFLLPPLSDNFRRQENLYVRDHCQSQPLR